jgi:hypothetical protein
MESVIAGQEDPGAAKVVADILKNADEAEAEASGELVSNLRAMVNNPAFSDVVFVCKDGNRVQASRLLLAGRSDVLKSMLLNGMAESNSSEIKSPETTSPVLLSVFEFLYTGTLLDYPPQNWRMSCEVLIASQFFLLPKLELITRKYMHAQTVSVATDLSKAALMLTEAVEFKPLWGEKTDLNLRELVSILSSNWSDPDFVKNLSEDAFHFLLANSKDSWEDADRFSFEQYLRFRQVVRWSC